MPFRYPISMRELLSWSKTEEEDYSSKKECPFSTNAELAVTLACYGFHRHKEKKPVDREIAFLSKDPIKFSTFANAELDFDIRLLGLHHSQDPSVADDEARLCSILEYYCDFGARELYERCVRWAPEESFVTIARELVKDLLGEGDISSQSHDDPERCEFSKPPLPPTI